VCNWSENRATWQRIWRQRRPYIPAARAVATSFCETAWLVKEFLGRQWANGSLFDELWFLVLRISWIVSSSAFYLCKSICEDGWADPNFGTWIDLDIGLVFVFLWHVCFDVKFSPTYAQCCILHRHCLIFTWFKAAYHLARYIHCNTYFRPVVTMMTCVFNRAHYTSDNVALLWLE